MRKKNAIQININTKENNSILLQHLKTINRYY